MQKIGDYRVIRELGAGGFGVVYLAEDEVLHEKVAIKVFRPKPENLEKLATNGSNETLEMLKERFINEAKILRQLAENPYIINRYDFKTLDDGAPYYVMPFIPNSLKKCLGSDATDVNVIAELASEDKPKSLPFNRAITIIEQLLIAMSAVHKAGIVHRDITTANVLLDEHENVKVCDFGIAKLPDSAGTNTSANMGSGDYRSPEQKQSMKFVDARSDVYSMGVVIYRMLCGTMPEARYMDPRHYNSEISDEMNAFILKALESNKDKRFTDGPAMLEQFQLIKQSLSGKNKGKDGTGTGDEHVPEIQPALKPLQQKICQLLLEEGYIIDKHNLSLQAMASVAGLTQEELEQFISGIEQELLSEITPFRNWLTFVDTQAKTHQGELDSEMTQVLLEAGQALGKDDDTLKGHIKAVCGRYQSAKKSVNPGQDVSEKTSRSASNDNSDKAHSSQKKTQPTPSGTEQSKAKTMDGMTTAGKKPDSVKMLTGVGLAVALGVGTWLYTGSEPDYPARALLDSMVTIPSGSYMMGSNDGHNDEKPVHRVSIKPFRLMEHEMTWAMYQPCIDAGVCPDNQKEGADEGWGKGNRPMINVSWNDITQKYIPWLNQQTGQTFRLPTEAEWEYAAREGTTTAFSTGECIDTRQANYDGNYDYNNCGAKTGTYLKKTVPVKSYQSNAFGLYDMHGNVWEWVQDCYNNSYNGAPANGDARTDGDCSRRVLRGGSWLSTPSNLRPSSRTDVGVSKRSYAGGFRLAQDL